MPKCTRLGSRSLTGSRPCALQMGKTVVSVCHSVCHGLRVLGGRSFLPSPRSLPSTALLATIPMLKSPLPPDLGLFYEGLVEKNASLHLALANRYFAPKDKLCRYVCIHLSIHRHIYTVSPCYSWVLYLSFHLLAEMYL